MNFFIKNCILILSLFLSSTVSKKGYGAKPNTKYTRPQGVSKQVKFTYYWNAIESEFPIKKGSPTTYIKHCNGKPLKKVSKKYQERVKMEGSGLLSNGKFINCYDDECNCFEYVDAPKGSRGNSLLPHTSIAANDIPFGMKVFVKELKGVKLPSSKQIHNGCVRVDDKGWSFKGNHIDWYVFDHHYYEKINARLKRENVTIQLNSPCRLLKYYVPLDKFITPKPPKKKPHSYYSRP